MTPTDADFMLAFLHDHAGDWVAHAAILDRSRLERGCGITVHSRAADLRKRGHRVECRTDRGPNGRTRSFYRLLAEPGALPPVARALSPFAADPPAPGSASMPETLFGETTARRPWWA